MLHACSAPLDTAARDRLILDHLAFAEKVTCKTLKRHPRWEEGISAGYEGLVRAARTYDPELGASFKTHAFRAVRSYVAKWWARETRFRSAHVGDWAELERYFGSDEAVRVVDAADKVRRLLGKLPESERRVLSLRYGIGADRPMTLREVASALRTTPVKVRALEARALKRLGA